MTAWNIENMLKKLVSLREEKRNYKKLQDLAQKNEAEDTMMITQIPNLKVHTKLETFNRKNGSSTALSHIGNFHSEYAPAGEYRRRYARL